jgi:hydrogenase maturation protease
VRGVDPGSVHQVHLSAQTGLAIGQERGSTHALGLGDAVELARVLDRLPSTLTIIGIEGADFTTGEGMSPEVEKAVIKVTDDLAQRLAVADPAE